MNKLQNQIAKETKISRKIMSFYAWRKVTRAVLFDGKDYFTKKINREKEGVE